MKTIKDIATQLLDERVKLYVKYDTETAKQYYFMCIFNDDLDFGINLVNVNIDIVLKRLKETDLYVFNRIKEVITSKLGCFEDIYIIYFFLFHEEGHWLEFLESGMTSKEYCNSIKLTDYNGELVKLSEKIKESDDNKELIESYRWRYRSTPYEKRADAYALDKLVMYLDKKERYMKNLWTTIMVKNMAESLTFYTEILGLEISNQIKAGPGMEIVFLGSGATKFELIANENAKNISYTDYVSTGFEVESVDDFISHLKDKGIDISEGPFEPSPYIKFFFIKDPNGYRIQLVENKR